MEEINFILEELKESFNGSIDHLKKALNQIRAGKASPQMLSTVKVEYYGALTPLSQVANVSTPDAKTLSVQPWEKNIIKDIEKAIVNANLGFAPSNNGESIIISLPPMTEERRKDLVKQAKAEAEKAKVSIRNSRKDANNVLKKLETISEDALKVAESDVQDLTNNFSKKVEEIFDVKQKEILTV